MGHDPCSHQVLVRLTGLPLQAWTTHEITSVLQELGHPLNILPFGREAGHYRDITALISTMNTNKIPMAYSYREGDYSVRVDILILASRLSQPGYFSSPEDQGFGGNGNRHSHRRQINPVFSLDRPSSSSSHNTPSEPTIDLSAWSPKSHRVLTRSQKNSKLQSSLSLPLTGNLQPPQPSPPSEIGTNLTIVVGGSKILLTHPPMHNLVTKDPDAEKNLFQTRPIPHLSLLTTPSPIPITLSVSLQVTLLKRTGIRRKPVVAPMSLHAFSTEREF